jgi:hypothetical protein
VKSYVRIISRPSSPVSRSSDTDPKGLSDPVVAGGYHQRDAFGLLRAGFQISPQT